MKILTFGVPDSGFVPYITDTYSSAIELFVCESRPHETDVSAWIAAQDGVSITVLTDNMVASLMREMTINTIYLFGTKSENDKVTTFPGSTMILDLAELFSITVYFRTIENIPKRSAEKLFDSIIYVDGAALSDCHPDTLKTTQLCEVV